jgi:hypothetical protein
VILPNAPQRLFYFLFSPFSAQIHIFHYLLLSVTDKYTSEFIPLSFWYDAPLTSPYSDRRHDPWLVYGSPSYSPAQWRSWISRA